MSWPLGKSAVACLSSSIHGTGVGPDLFPSTLVSSAALTMTVRTPALSSHMGCLLRPSAAKCFRALSAKTQDLGSSSFVCRAASTKTLLAPKASSHIGRLFR